MEEINVLSELGEWKDCIGYPLYSISSTGVFMNKRTLKILKHFRHKDSDEPAVTLYISGKSGHVLSVDGLLKTNFGPDATLPEVVYTNDKTTELGPPRPEKRNNLIKKASNEGHLDENGFCKFCGWNSAFPESHTIFLVAGNRANTSRGSARENRNHMALFL